VELAQGVGRRIYRGGEERDSLGEVATGDFSSSETGRRGGARSSREVHEVAQARGRLRRRGERTWLGLLGFAFA